MTQALRITTQEAGEKSCRQRGGRLERELRSRAISIAADNFLTMQR